MMFKVERRVQIGEWETVSAGHETVEAAIAAKDDRFIERVMEDPHEGWIIRREVGEGGLYVLRDPSGRKVATAQSRTAISIARARRCTGR